MNIVITGKGSYMGTHIKKWLENKNENISVTEVDMITDEWKEFDFSNADCVVHVAGIVHKRDGEVEEETYKKINTDLALSVAEKSKSSGVKMFLFISTMAVYGLESTLPETSVVYDDTVCKPYNFYGKSKLEAEKLIVKLADENFTVSVVRPPNVYGTDAPAIILINL